MTGLSDGTAYTFTVTATTAAGTCVAASRIGAGHAGRLAGAPSG